VGTGCGILGGEESYSSGAAELLHHMIVELEQVTIMEGSNDCIVWVEDSSNFYSVKLAYNVLMEDSNPGSTTQQ